VCHLDTCPVGVATQDPELRARYSGLPEYVVTFFEFVAQQVREHLAALGFRTLEEAVGHVEMLDTRAAVDHWKAQGLDLGPVLAVPEVAAGSSLHHARAQDHGLEHALDNQLIVAAEPALERGEAVRVVMPVRNVNRTVGTMLGHEVTKRYGARGLPDGTIDIELTGSAGQSFGAFLPPGVTLRLFGDANDYVGKGLSGGRIVVRPERTAVLDPRQSVIAGNVVGYGATSGEMFLCGLAGERFGVRASGATLVVDGVGDHACEYMTGGTVVVLGPTGRNLGAGMSGGVAYVVDLDASLVSPAALAAGELMLGPLDDDDWATVHALVAAHVEHTGSPGAAALLDDLDGTRARFTRVLPAEYARVRQALARAAADGLDLEAPGVWNAVLAGAHG
jgi:glutamate synthase (NADPH/NADH) large chain